MQLVVATDADGVYEALQTQVGDERVLCLLHDEGEDGEVGLPGVFEHWLDGRRVLHQVERVAFC